MLSMRMESCTQLHCWLSSGSLKDSRRICGTNADVIVEAAALLIAAFFLSDMTCATVVWGQTGGQA